MEGQGDRDLVFVTYISCLSHLLNCSSADAKTSGSLGGVSWAGACLVYLMDLADATGIYSFREQDGVNTCLLGALWHSGSVEILAPKGKEVKDKNG